MSSSKIGSLAVFILLVIAYVLSQVNIDDLDPVSRPYQLSAYPSGTCVAVRVVEDGAWVCRPCAEFELASLSRVRVSPQMTLADCE
jgi:hypothetical protein